MAATTADKKLSNYWPRLSSTQKNSLLQVMKNYLEPVNNTDDDVFVPELGCTINEYNKEIEEAEAEIDRGGFYTNDEVKEMFKEWDSKHMKLSGAKGQ